MKSTALTLQKLGGNARLRADLALFAASIVWGTGFAVQRVTAVHIGVFLFNGIRFFIGALFLLVLLRFRLKIERKEIPWVVLAGALLFTAGGFQQAGLRTTSAANAGFITGLYTILVPIVLWAGFGRKINSKVWIAAGIAVCGNLLLSLGADLKFATGDLLELVGALLWSFHIIVITRQAKRMEAFQLNAAQLLVAGLLNLAAGLLFEGNSMNGLPSVAWLILYSGLVPVGIGFTLQVVGQKKAPPSDAALIMSMEAVFGALSGFIFLGERLAALQILGCGLIFGAILLSQYPFTNPELTTTAPVVSDRSG